MGPLKYDADVKAVPLHAMKALGGSKYSSYSFSTSALDAGSGQRHAPDALYPRGMNAQYPLYRRLGGPQSRSGHRGYRKNPFRLCRGSNLDRPVVQPVARHYTD
jgi:hypothetical protein